MPKVMILDNQLSDVFKLDYKETLAKVNSTSSVETIIKKVEQDKVNELKTWMKENKIGVGINIDEDTKRYYPYNNLASQVVGVCGADNQGLSGIEYSYDSILKGVSGQITTSTDAANTYVALNASATNAGSDIVRLLGVNSQGKAISITPKAIVEYVIKTLMDDDLLAV